MQRRVGPADLSGNGDSAHAHERYSLVLASERYSLVLASDYRVDNIERMWSSIAQHRTQLTGLGAHHVVLYVSIAEPDRVLMTIGLRHHRPVNELLRSPVLFEWFDMAGVNNIPAIFAGRVVEKIDLTSGRPETVPAGVVVGAVSAVGDVDALMSGVRTGLDRLATAGVRKLWIYRAIDDTTEILTLLQVDSAEAAQRWIERPDAAAAWMPGPATTPIARRTEEEPGAETPPGTGAYPDIFVGQLANIMSTEATR